MKTLHQFMNESFDSFDAERYRMANGRRPGGVGNWIFTKHKSGVDWDKHKEGHDHITINGPYGEAKKKAKAWAKEKGHSIIHTAT